MSELPSWYPFEPDDPKPAPMPLLLIQAFLNTRYYGEGLDLLGNPESARAWMTAAGLMPPSHSLGSVELERVRAVRESIRSLLPASGKTPPPAELDPLRELTASNRIRLTIDQHGIDFDAEPTADLGTRLLGLLVTIRDAQRDGTWDRLKICANPECLWVFYDRSRNHHGNWCDMTVCGNRIKNRRLRAKHRQTRWGG